MHCPFPSSFGCIIGRMFHFLSFLSLQPSHNKTYIILVSWLCYLHLFPTIACISGFHSCFIISFSSFFFFIHSSQLLWEMISSAFRSWLTAFSILLSSDSCLSCVCLFVFSLIIIFSP
ncbi:uncharacterized protein BO88DRAFT_126199 [Aspergillus vadensis CBS 113365]|uniref:Uncharacterized protein n=1 Tax=Aspergillus vadensis (strain CBS 113365 / IMI 142717 / IBT 24658) TaxID=1448311 RepID=A0A319B2Y6_ASPVC|nr:hypothetical protein BO88DRAFT_126199 [Aspergillus vadensis CBS 113365]PYH66194.1 hypothetical protein BO88DRAFT_126199 [Aspergillus vadensis CBS 113365]